MNEENIKIEEKMEQFKMNSFSAWTKYFDNL